MISIRNQTKSTEKLEKIVPINCVQIDVIW